MGLKNTGGYIYYDGNDLNWLDPSKPAARQYLCGLAAEIAQLGFDEILLTDLSYPTEGKLDKIDYNGADRGESIRLFLEELRAVLAEYGAALSVELPAETILSGRDDIAGLVLADIAPLADRVYAVTTAGQIPALTEAVAAASAIGAELPESVRDFVFALLGRFDQVGAMLVEPDNYWVIRWGDESIEGVAQRRDMYMREGCCRMYSEEEGPKRWHKVVLIVPPEQIPTVRAYVEAQNPQGFYPVQSDAFYLELVPQGISKGRGMRMIQQALGLTKTAAIGDRETDAGAGGFFRCSQKRRPRPAKRG